MRALSVVAAGSLLAACATNTYEIPAGELARLVQTPPEQRGAYVHVVQDLVQSDVPPAPPVTGETDVIIAPRIEISGAIVTRHHPSVSGAGAGGNGQVNGPAGDGKAAAIAILVAAATVVVTGAVVEAARFDGFVQLHPMQPVHLLGKDGREAVLPLAWLDGRAIDWTDTAIVRSTEGPWLPIERAPLTRTGLTASMYGGTGSLRSADGSLAMGPAWTIQLGLFANQQLGIVASQFFGWRDNAFGATLLESRTTGELQYLPLQLGILHAGLYGGIGVAYRAEDAIRVGNLLVDGNDTSAAFDGGAMFQLALTTRLALTGRLGTAYAHGEQMHDALIGISVY